MIEDAVSSQQSGSGRDPEETDTEIVVIAKRLSVPSDGGGGGGGGFGSAIIVRIGGINHPDNRFVEPFRALVTDVTDFDLDPSFTPKQREIILKVIQGLVDHPRFADKMAELLAKGADINIIADFSGRHTGSDHSILDGRNEDGTVDRGESMTIYINMNHGGAPISGTALALAIIHELIHALGDPALDALLHAGNGEFERGPFRDIFSGYDFFAPAAAESAQAEIISVPDGGGAVAGTGDFAVYNGSDHADRIAPGPGGGLVYSGGGDDRVVLSPGAVMTELVDGGGADTVELPAGVSPADVALRWSSDGSNLSVLISGTNRLTVLNANGAGALEHLSIGGSDHSLASLPQAVNRAPVANEYQTTVEGSFFGGYVGNGSASDLDGDRISYKLEMVTGEFAEAMWSVDPQSGAIYGDFTRMEQHGSAYSFVTVSAHDGIETAASTLMIRWGRHDEFPTPYGATPEPVYGDERMVPTLFSPEAALIGGDPGAVYV